MIQSLFELIWHVLSTLSGMVWQIYWPLAFGLMLSSVLRNILPLDVVVKHLGKTNGRSLVLTTLLGMVSSSCSYAAASMSKTLLIKHATLANSMAFLVASTNLILEMFIVLVSLLGWQFLWGEISGGLLLVVIVGFIFRFYPKAQSRALRDKLQSEEKGASTEMKCGAAMPGMAKATTNPAPSSNSHKNDVEMKCGADMAGMAKAPSDPAPNSNSHKNDAEMKCGADMAGMAKAPSDPAPNSNSHKSDAEMKCGAGKCGADMSGSDSAQNKTTESHYMDKVRRSAGYFYMDLGMIGKDIIIGVVISSVLIALVPADWWRELFISSQVNLPAWLHSLLDVLVGIFVAVIAYVCSVGNLLLAAALWHGGISFGGVIGFILADVLTIPMLGVYAKYYGAKPARWIGALLFLSILATGIIIDLIYMNVDWSASKETIRTLHQSGFGWNFTTVMNVIFIPLSIWYYRLGKS
ncbi:permease [Shewanella halifaxensis HAW-EB4]|uniref:Permease n=1 Tax=Shewanella halifaxensis (strain HAW-EB4) TaxID=458817 RepID=B0TN64_SHEHH|nr:permease [Shewanella halifaxensis]ABZ74776.1 permease [Shewanella halifaxensis HAW-EB4]